MRRIVRVVGSIVDVSYLVVLLGYVEVADVDLFMFLTMMMLWTFDTEIVKSDIGDGGSNSGQLPFTSPLSSVAVSE